MARITATGDIQPEQGDVLPLEVAIRDDDPAHIVEFIKQVNPTIMDGDDLVQATAHVDKMRQEHRESLGLKENPHVTSTLDEPEAPKEQTSATMENKPVTLLQRERGR